MVRMLQGAGRGGLKEWMLQLPHRGGLVDLMVPHAGRGGLMERMLQGSHHGGPGGLELGVLAAQPPCCTSWSPRALGQGTDEGALLHSHGVLTRCWLWLHRQLRFMGRSCRLSGL